MQQQYLQVDKNQLNVQQVPPAPPEVVELMDEDDNDSLRLHQPFEGNSEEQTQNSEMLTLVDNCKEDGQLPQSNFNNSNHQNQSTIIPPHRQKEKAQCAAADSTVTSTSTPNNGSSLLTILLFNINICNCFFLLKMIHVNQLVLLMFLCLLFPKKTLIKQRENAS
jgi:hypothetical protein